MCMVSPLHDMMSLLQHVPTLDLYFHLDRTNMDNWDWDRDNPLQ